MSKKRKTNFTKLLKKGIWILFASCLLSSCANVSPTIRERETVAYEGNEENAGVIGDLPDGSTEITPGRRERYNQLIEDFAKYSEYKIEKDFQIKKLESGNYSITNEGLEREYDLKLIRKRQRVNNSH